MKKLISHILIVSMLISLLSAFALGVSADTDTPTYKTEPIDVWDGTTVDTTFGGGDGSSEATAIEITSAAELAGVAQLVNNGTSYAGKYLKLTKNIDLNNKTWTPIGKTQNTYCFNGTFDGAGYYIKNLNIPATTDANCIGLFGWIPAGCIKNVGIESGTIILPASNIVYAGSIAGLLQESNQKGGSVTNCYSKVNISISSGRNAMTYLGGIVGATLGTYASISKCIYYGTLNTEGNNRGSGANFGGIVAWVSGITVSDCYNVGTIIGNSKWFVGGIIGTSQNNSAVIENCASSALVYGSKGFEGLIAAEHANGIPTYTNVTAYTYSYPSSVSGYTLATRTVGNPNHIINATINTTTALSLPTADGEDFINATERGAKWGVELTGADVALGESIEVRYYAHIGSEYTDSEMTFVMNEAEKTVKGSPTETANEYMFVFDGIAPQCMGDNVSATLTVDGKTADTKEEYSVLSNLEYLLATYTANEYAEMRTLIYDLLAYGAAAQQYKGYKTDALVNAGYEDKATDFETVSAALADCEKDLGEATDANNRFAAAGVNFSSVNKVYYKVKTNDISKITLTVGEVTYTAEDFEVSGAYYIVYADAATPTEFGVAKLATLKFDGQEVQTLSYSINSYIHSMKDNTTMQTLVKALYCYGVSAASYAN